MMKLFFSLLLIMFSFIMMFFNNPLSMGLMILTQTLMICILSGMIINTYWFSYILFITFLGGLLVLFIYVSSIASNEMFKMNINFKKIFTFIVLLTLMIMYMYKYNLSWMNLSINSDMSNFYSLMLFLNNENKINLSKLYNNQTFLIMLMLIIYLFITLIAVVKITNIFYGPIRSTL